MRTRLAVLEAFFFSVSLLGGCAGGGTTPPPVQTQTAAPTITTADALGGAEMVTMASPTSGAAVYYTIDGTTPTSSSQVYAGPFLVASNLTINAIATATGDKNSTVTTKAFAANIPSGTLVWSDEFNNSTRANVAPDPKVWGYDTGLDCCGNNELETYCAATGATVTAPCDPANPNAYVGTDHVLHIVARNPSSKVYTSARLKSEGLFSFQYGRIEAKLKIPESQSMWPAFWLLGNNISTDPWPACGELDVMEHINGNNSPMSVGAAAPGYDWTQSSVHGTGLNGGNPFHPAGFSAAAWHIYGMIWSKGQVQYYVDDPTNIYETFTATGMAGTWPFDQGPEFVILNLAVGGDWPGSPDSTTVFPSEFLVDYVRVYAN